jgi:hypothetical protein
MFVVTVSLGATFGPFTTDFEMEDLVYAVALHSVALAASPLDIM